MFGELIGLWCAVTWQQLGSPAPLRLVELGPGRGTLMRDALRAAARRVPGFLEAATRAPGRDQRLRLREAAAGTRWLGRRLAGTPAAVTWHRHIAERAGRAGHRRRQRVSRRPADPPARPRRRCMARARRGAVMREGALTFAPGREGRTTQPTRPARAAARRHRRAARRRGATARRAGRALSEPARRALHRLRPRVGAPSAIRCRRCAATPTSIRWPSPAPPT